MNGKWCQVVLRNKCYDNPKKECNSVRKSVNKITNEKECNIGTENCARLKMSSNVARFLNNRRLENATLETILSVMVSMVMK